MLSLNIDFLKVISNNFRINSYELANSFIREKHKGEAVLLFSLNLHIYTKIIIYLNTDLDFKVSGIELYLNSLGRIAIVALHRSPSGVLVIFIENF